MAVDRSAELMQSLVAKLYTTITGNGDGKIKLPRSKFVSWCSPGIPFTVQDFEFASKGLVGDTAEETRALEHQAWTVAKIFDYIPEVGEAGFIDKTMQQTIFASTQDTISKVFGDVLRFSKVLDNELSDEEKAKLQRFRDLLVVEKENILGDIVTVPGPIVEAYNTKMNEWLDAVDEYCNVLVDAQSAKGSDPEAIRRVALFSNKASSLIKKVQAAESAWITQGYKNEYEQIQAYIAQVTEKSLVLYKEDLKHKYAAAKKTSTNEGSAGEYFYTTLLPGNFAKARSWTRFRYFSEDFETHSKKDISSWKAKAGLNFGLFSIGGSAGGSRTEQSMDVNRKNFYAEFEFTQIPIVRPWFDPGFFTMRAWTLDDAWKLNFDKEVSDGAEVPAGRLVAYPVTALFVRNLKIKLDASDAHSRYIKSQVEGGATVGWGPFQLGGGYSHGSERRDFKSHADGGEINVDGIQLIGLINNLIPKSPNTNPAIRPDQFVGGASVIDPEPERKP